MVWKVIKSGWEAFSSRIKFKMGNGRGMKFQKDKWCGDLSLKEAFPTLFYMVNTKDAQVVEVRDEEGDKGCQNPRLYGQLHVWGLEQIKAFFRPLQSQSIDGDIVDKWYGKS